MNIRLKELRHYLGLTQYEFGKSIFLSQGQISILELGKATITQRTIHLVCIKYKVDKHWLLTGQEPMFKTPTVIESL
ncbi:helix-turn-helix domain-containing protein [Clostridium sp.]|uniref:helix-turn-helix domain-containing protein n=1 Tax=Clostridium sp. TaxID=1506 RepID=UPI003F30C3B2